VLPRAARLRSSREFGLVTRSGARGKAGRVVAYLLTVPTPEGASTSDPEVRARLGLIVSKGVGNSVYRHRVARVIRHGAADTMKQLPSDTVVVIRALPGSYERGSPLADDVRRAIRRAMPPAWTNEVTTSGHR